MKAARFRNPKEPVRLEEVGKPQPEEGEALVRVEACGICGTDVHIAKEGVLPTAFSPITLGHEIAGEIAAVSAGGHVRAGERVLIYPQQVCGSCPYCRTGQENLCLKPLVFGMQRDGGMAEFVVAPIANLIPLPENVPSEVGAILADAVATPYHAIVRRGKLKEGESVAIFGCGGLGYHATKLCKLLGANPIVAVDVEEAALQRAQKAGATEVVSAKEEDPVKKIKGLVKGGVDIAFEFIGLSKTIAQAVQVVRRGGRAVVCGIGMDPITLPPPFVFVGNELSLLGSFGSTREDIKDVLSLVEKQALSLDDSITRAFPLPEANEALEALQQREGNPVRFVILPDLV